MNDGNGRVAGIQFAKIIGFLVCSVALVCQGCSKRNAKHAAERAASQVNEDDDISPKDRAFMKAGKPFVEAVASGNLKDAFAELSTHAKRRMTGGQFGGGDPKTEEGFNAEHRDVTLDQFEKLFERVEKKFGKPEKLTDLSVSESDPNILAGNAKENIDRFSAMIAIGGMPADIPASIRKAALRAQVQVVNPEKKPRKKAAKKEGDDDDDGNDDEHPYFNVKYVLVEEDGKLKVGYFEFFPPSILD